MTPSKVKVHVAHLVKRGYTHEPSTTQVHVQLYSMIAGTEFRSGQFVGSKFKIGSYKQSENFLL